MLTLLSFWSFTSHSEPLMLKDPVIHLIDGMTIGINGQKIGFMLQIRRKIQIMQYGTKITDNPPVLQGTYTFESKLYSIHELAQLESEKNIVDSDELKQVLMIAKKEFVKEIMSFMGMARDFKNYITRLIDESCKRRNRKNSELRRWSAAKDGSEEKQFHEDIQDFKTFNLFCTDLSNFLEDLVHSCPKGQKQLQQMIASHHK